MHQPPATSHQPPATSHQFRWLKTICFSLLVLNLTTSCEKDVLENTTAKEKYTAPKLDAAMQFFNANKRASASEISIGKSTATTNSVIHWEGSIEKKFIETADQEVDILYTPIYLNTTRTDTKAFVASTQHNGVIESRRIYIQYKTNDLSNGLSAYILEFGSDGIFKSAYNYENGVSISFPERKENIVAKISSTGPECPNSKDVSEMTAEEYEEYQTTGSKRYGENCLGAIFLTGSGSSPTGNGNTFMDGAMFGNIRIDPVDSWNTIPSNGNNSNSNNHGGSGNNSNWVVPNVTVGNAPSITAALSLNASSLQALWLGQQEVSNQQLLTMIADFINQSRDHNPFSGSGFENIPGEMFPLSDQAQRFLIDLIDDFRAGRRGGIQDCVASGGGNLLDCYDAGDSFYTIDNYPGIDNGYPFKWWEDEEWIMENMKMPADILGDDDEKPNAMEAILFARYPNEAILHIANSNAALNEAQNKAIADFGTNQQAISNSLVNGKYDAFRHAYWNALGTAEFGKTIMSLFATAHEYGQGNGKDVEMDLSNNLTGRNVSTSNDYGFFTSNSTISSAIMDTLNNGNLVRFSVDSSGNITLVPTP